METLLTLPVRISILLSIAALVGTTCFRATEHLRTSDDTVLTAELPAKSPKAVPAENPTVSIPLRVFIPVTVAGLLLCLWQTADFSKPRKRPSQNNHLDCPASRKYMNRRDSRR